MYGLFVLPESLALEHRRSFSLARANPIGSLRALGRHPIALGPATSVGRGKNYAWLWLSEGQRERYGNGIAAIVSVAHIVGRQLHLR